jgi:hypothetical protein
MISTAFIRGLHPSSLGHRARTSAMLRALRRSFKQCSIRIVKAEVRGSENGKLPAPPKTSFAPKHRPEAQARVRAARIARIPPLACASGWCIIYEFLAKLPGAGPLAAPLLAAVCLGWRLLFRMPRRSH